MEELRSSIYEHDSIGRIENLMRKFKPELLFSPDEDKLDMMHHCILAKYEGAIGLLDHILMSNTEISSRLEGSLGYLHLAALIGDSSIVKMLCEISNSGVDVKCGCTSWPDVEILWHYAQKGRDGCHRPGRVWNNFESVLSEISRFPNESVYPVDVAALCGNIDCVRLLLSAHSKKLGPKKSSSTTSLDQAMDIDSMTAFKLLASQSNEPGNLAPAFLHALRQLLPAYVTVLLECGVDTVKALSGSNPYHIACMQTRMSAMQDRSRRFFGLDELTSLLIDHGFDVNSHRPLGMYPLYSLIYSLVREKDANPAYVPVYHINALKQLLHAGADPNYDEIQASKKDTTFNPMLASRDLSCSALDAYFSCLQSCDTWRPHLMQHLDLICLTLLEHGADAGRLNVATGETPLHRLIHVMANQHAMGHMHADLSTMCRMLLYFGANPNQRSREGLYPVHHYFTCLLRVMGGTFAFQRWRQFNIATQVLHIFMYMDIDDAANSSSSIIEELKGSLDVGDGIDGETVEYVSGLLTEYTCTVKTLQDLSKLAVWKAVGRKVNNLKLLTLPKALVAAIKDLFVLDI